MTKMKTCCANDLLVALRNVSDPKRAQNLARFFKTKKGEYGEGDRFWGITVPNIRNVVKKYADISRSELVSLLQNPIHEIRLTALLIMVGQFAKATEVERGKIVKIYLANTARINNWDLVDLSAPNIVGRHLLSRDRRILYKLAKSNNLWERRIAILSTFTFIRNNEYQDALSISEMLLLDKHDLIHKAVGWMLREVGKRDTGTLIGFLDKFSLSMPRTMLRYAIEKLPEKQRQYYLKRRSAV